MHKCMTFFSKIIYVKHMIKLVKILLVVCGVVFISSCSFIVESVKKVAGVSTESLDKARASADIARFSCDIDECMDVVVGLSKSVGEGAFVRSKKFDIFREDRVGAVIVVMGVKGSINTTEVGIFFSKYTSTQTQVDVSSLSSTARRTVSPAVFDALGAQFERLTP